MFSNKRYLYKFIVINQTLYNPYVFIRRCKNRYIKIAATLLKIIENIWQGIVSQKNEFQLISELTENSIKITERKAIVNSKKNKFVGQHVQK